MPKRRLHSGRHIHAAVQPRPRYFVLVLSLHLPIPPWYQAALFKNRLDANRAAQLVRHDSDLDAEVVGLKAETYQEWLDNWRYSSGGEDE